MQIAKNYVSLNSTHIKLFSFTRLSTLFFAAMALILAVTVQAEAATTYILTTSSGTGGAISPATSSFATGTVVNITATPTNGYVFIGWEGAGTGTCVGMTNPCAVMMDADKTLAAMFASSSATYTLTTGAGTGGVISPGTSFYSVGTVVTVAAIPNNGYTFTGWIGACSGTGSCNVIMNADKTVGASFGSTDRILITSAGTGGTITPPTGSYALGTVVTATATPNKGYRFAGWIGACAGTGACAVTLDADKTLGATFTPIPKTFVASTVVPDLNANGQVELATLYVDYATGMHTVKITDSYTSDALNTLTFASSVKKPDGIVAINDLDGNGVPEIAVLFKNTVMIKDAKNNDIVLNRFAVSEIGYKATDISVSADLNGNGSSELIIMGVNTATGKARTEIRDSKTGLLVNKAIVLQ
jgi:uncharacterized repeat protein (TIGR02543 family)